MKTYSHYGYNDFLICLGYKGYVIKEYFANYYRHMADAITYDFNSENGVEVLHTAAEPWKVTLVETGLNTMDVAAAEKLLNLLSAGEKLILRFENCFEQEDGAPADTALLDNLTDLTREIETQTKDEQLPNRIKEISLNLYDSIETLKETREKAETFLFCLRYHLKSLFRILEFEIAYLVEDFVDQNNHPRFYPESVRIDPQEIRKQGKTAKCQASVVVLAYNNLSYVRECVKSILENTDDVDYELILVDNGSTDGTGAYFDSITGAKVIHLKYNLHVVKGFNIGLLAAEGKYSAAVCNDFIFTKNWLSNLLICMPALIPWEMHGA